MIMRQDDQFKLNQITTKELSDELSRRAGVTVLNLGPHQEMQITAGSNDRIIQGPAIILINQD